MKIGLFEYTFKVKYMDDDKVKNTNISQSIPMQFIEESPVMGDEYLERFTQDVIIDPREQEKIRLIKEEIKIDFEEFGYKVIEVI